MSKFFKHNSKRAKLSPTLVQDIRSKYASGHFTQGELARLFNMSAVQIGRIVRGESWNAMPLAEPTAADHDEIIHRALLAQQEGKIMRGEKVTNPLYEEPDETAPSPLDRLNSELRNRNPDAMLEDLKKMPELPKTPVKPEVEERAREFLGPTKGEKK